MYAWKTEIAVYHPEVIDKVTGKKKKIPVFVRKLLLRGKGAMEPDCYSITAQGGSKKNNTPWRFTIRGLLPPQVPFFQTIILDFRQRPQAEWKKVLGKLTQAQLQAWLTERVIDPANAIEHLQNDKPPEKEAA